MANETDQKVSFKISAADGSDSSNQNYDEEDEGWFASFARRFISKFTRRRSSSVENNNDSRIRQMPGKRRMNIFDLYSLKKVCFTIYLFQLIEIQFNFFCPRKLLLINLHDGPICVSEINASLPPHKCNCASIHKVQSFVISRYFSVLILAFFRF